jgi:small-conductance mechanosensitive channel
VSATEGIEQTASLLRGALAYPIIHTEGHPITLTTLITAALVLGVALLASPRLQSALRRRLLSRLRLGQGLEFSILRFVHYAVLTAGVLVALKMLHVDLTGLAVLAGLLSVGIGFGLQNLASNFIAGIILLIERPITVGDHVTVGDINGFVRAINIRSTEVLTNDNISVIVPNSEFVAGRVVNWSHGDPRLRIRIPVGVSCGSDVENVSRILVDVARQHPDVLRDPPPEVCFVRFGSWTLDFALEAWIAEPRQQERVASALHYGIHAAFIEHAIEMPSPRQDIRVRSALAVSLLPDTPPR